MSYLTVSELETRAYLAGNIELSNTLSRLDDCHAALAQAMLDYENLQYENKNLGYELQLMKGQLC